MDYLREIVIEWLKMTELFGLLVWLKMEMRMQWLHNTRRYSQSLEKIKKVIPPREGEIMFGLNMVVGKGKTVFIGDTSVNEYPSSKELAEIAISSARVVKIIWF